MLSHSALRLFSLPGSSGSHSSGSGIARHGCPTLAVKVARVILAADGGDPPAVAARNEGGVQLLLRMEMRWLLLKWLLQMNPRELLPLEIIPLNLLRIALSSVTGFSTSPYPLGQMTHPSPSVLSVALTIVFDTDLAD